MILVSMAECEQSLALLVRKDTNKIRAHQTMSPIFLLPFSANLIFPLPNSTFDLRHVAARDGKRFVAVLDEQLGGAGM